MGTWQDDYAETRPDPGDDVLFRDVSDNGTNADGKVKRALIVGLVQQGLYVKDQLATPPGSPAVGDRYIVIATATGDWASQETKITEWDGAAWQFLSPSEGWQIYDQDGDVRLEFDGTAWAAAGAGTVSGLTDTTITSPADGEVLTYDSGTSKWVNAAPSGGASFSGARATLSTNLTSTNANGGYVVPFNSESFDTDSYHDNSTNNSRLTVPSGISYVDVGAVFKVSAHTEDENFITRIRKNGSTIISDIAVDTVNNTNHRVTTSTGPLAVTSGDYFELQVFSQADTSVTIESDITALWIRGYA